MVRGADSGREKEKDTDKRKKNKTFTACPAPSSVSREQGIMEMYKCKREGD